MYNINGNTKICVGNCLVVKISLGKSLHTHKGFSFMCTDLEVCVGNGLLIKISLGKLYTHKGFSFRWTASIGKLHAHKVSLSGGLPWSLWRQLLFVKILLGKLHAHKKSIRWTAMKFAYLEFCIKALDSHVRYTYVSEEMGCRDAHVFHKFHV